MKYFLFILRYMLEDSLECLILLTPDVGIGMKCF